MIGKVLEWVQGAHPVFYFGLLMLAGLGIPVSEDGLAIWAGGLLGRGEAPVRGRVPHGGGRPADPRGAGGRAAEAPAAARGSPRMAFSRGPRP